MRFKTSIIALAVLLGGSALHPGEAAAQPVFRFGGTGAADGDSSPVTPPGEQPPTAAGDRFTPGGPVDLVVDEGARVSQDIGSFEGPASQWTCGTVAEARWLRCLFEDGRVRLEGTAPAAVSGGFEVSISRPGYSVTVPGDYAVLPVSRTARLAPPSSRYVPNGATYSWHVGTYTGTPDGWSCSTGSSGPMPSWQSCTFEDGIITLSATGRTGTGGAHQYLRVLHGTRSVALSSYFHIYNSLNGDQTAPEPASGVASATLPDASHYIPSSGGRAMIGTYEGESDGWTCFGADRALPGWATCEFKDGEIVLTGTPGRREETRLRLGVARHGVVGAVTGYVYIYSERPVAADSLATAPRVGSASLFGSSAYVPIGGGRASVGTYTGSDEGWVCFASYNALPIWADCEFDDGNIVLVGTPTSASWTRLELIVARDGRVRAKTGYLAINAEAQRTNGPVSDVARAGTAVLNTGGYMIPVGGGRAAIGTYTGGDGGWACYGSNNRPIPAWATCEFRDGNIVLTGTPSTRSDNHLQIGVSRDGRQVHEVGYVYIWSHHQHHRVQVQDRARSGSASLQTGTWQIGSYGRVAVGTYEGEGGGWSCFGAQRSLPSGTFCEFVDGQIWFVAENGAVGDVFVQVGVARDGLMRHLSSYLTARVVP